MLGFSWQKLKLIKFPPLEIWVAAIFIFLAVAVLLNRQNLQELYLTLKSSPTESTFVAEETEIAAGSKTTTPAPKKINTPPPLRAKQESPQAFLTLDGIVSSTNTQRAQNGLPPLTNNDLLNQAAFNKAQDMFEKQYFAHDSPEGLGVADLAANVGYQYITIGENLALGNFLNDTVVVQAWMDSPGHRANILNSKYTQIGVGVMRATYEGRTTWIAVQHFGFPLSACPQPDSSLASTIQSNNNQLEVWANELSQRKKELDEMEPKHGPEYNQKAEEYNALVEQYNHLVEETKNLVEQYNNQVAAFNACAS